MSNCSKCGKFDNWGDFIDGVCLNCTPVSEARQQTLDDDIRRRELRDEADKLAKSVLISTTDSIHGRVISTHLGIARGGTVRAKDAVSDFGAGIKNLVGGEIKVYTELLAHAREQAIHRMKVDAVMLGADAVVGVNFSTSVIDIGAAEITAFGTAVTLSPEVNDD